MGKLIKKALASQIHRPECRMDEKMADMIEKMEERIMNRIERLEGNDNRRQV
jgi:hypothetical protein